MRIFTTISPQNVLRLMLIALGLSIFYYGWNGILPHQLAGSPLFDISLDNTFWIFHLSGFPSWLNGIGWLIGGQWMIWVMELLFVLTGGFLFYRYHPAVTPVFLVLLVILSLFMQSYSGVLTKISVILPIVFFPYCFKGELFNYTWKFPRYYLIYLMVSAALFKIFNGGLFFPGQMENIIWNQHSDLELYGSHHISAWISNVIIFRPSLAWIAYAGIFVCEISFATLLFTKKWDAGFIVILLLFCLGIYLVMRINTLEMVFLLFPLLKISSDND